MSTYNVYLLTYYNFIEISLDFSFPHRKRLIPTDRAGTGFVPLFP